MKELFGKYGYAKVFTDNVEQQAIDQVIELLNQEWTDELKIRMLSDIHAGKGCVIGTTMTIKDKIVPNLCGVDIGCGVLVVNLGKIDLDLQQLDKIIHEKIPSGFNVRDVIHSNIALLDLENLRCKSRVDLVRAYLSLGTLGGGWR